MNTVIDQTPQWDNQQIYNKECLWTIENYHRIKMMYIVFELAPINATTPTVIRPTSPFLIENVQLESNGVPIARVSTTSTMARIDMTNSNLYQRILNGCNITGLFDSSRTISLPLFFWPIDNQELDTRIYQGLTVRLRTKASFTEMGFSSGLGSLNAKLRVLYTQDLPLLPLDLKQSYNIYENLKYLVTSTSSSYSVMVSVPYNVIRIFALIKNNTDKLFYNIDRIVVTKPNGKRYVFDEKTNYYLNDVNGANDGSSFVININDLHQDASEIFNRNKAPLNLLFEYTPNVAGNGTLNLAFEYRSDIQENKTDNGINLLENTLNLF